MYDCGSKGNDAPNKLTIQTNSKWSPCIADSNDVSLLSQARSIRVVADIYSIGGGVIFGLILKYSTDSYVSWNLQRFNSLTPKSVLAGEKNRRKWNTDFYGRYLTWEFNTNFWQICPPPWRWNRKMDAGGEDDAIQGCLCPRNVRLASDLPIYLRDNPP